MPSPLFVWGWAPSQTFVADGHSRLFLCLPDLLGRYVPYTRQWRHLHSTFNLPTMGWLVYGFSATHTQYLCWWTNSTFCSLPFFPNHHPIPTLQQEKNLPGLVSCFQFPQTTTTYTYHRWYCLLPFLVPSYYYHHSFGRILLSSCRATIFYQTFYLQAACLCTYTHYLNQALYTPTSVAFPQTAQHARFSIPAMAH